MKKLLKDNFSGLEKYFSHSKSACRKGYIAQNVEDTLSRRMERTSLQ